MTVKVRIVPVLVSDPNADIKITVDLGDTPERVAKDIFELLYGHIGQVSTPLQDHVDTVVERLLVGE